VKLIPHLQLVLKLRMCGALPPLSNMSSWYGDKEQEQFYLVPFSYNGRFTSYW